MNDSIHVQNSPMLVSILANYKEQLIKAIKTNDKKRRDEIMSIIHVLHVPLYRTLKEKV